VAILKTTLGTEFSEPPKKRGSNKFVDKTPGVLVITKISQQVKRQDRYSIYVNEKYTFSLSEYQLAGSGLRVGKQFTQAELDELIGESNFGKAYERSLNYVMIRPRSEREIKDYLTRTFLYPKSKTYVDKAGKRHFVKQEVDKEKTNQMITRVIDRLRTKGYINDEAFAKAWISSRQLTKKSSKRKLEQELRAKNVDQDIISTLLQSADINEEVNLRAFIDKKRRNIKYHDDVKLTQYLLRQGFNYQDIKDALSNNG